ncbi:MAG: tRNA nucleotidyltransferase/poly(A) polymerase family protein [Planctomycetota bacterium]|jgi:poly(A) polymerase
MTNKQAAIKVIRRLNRKGFQALLAGGCVRDMLLGQRPKDYDVAANAQPKDVIELFKRTLKVGAKFGVVIVMLEDRQVEVATFRTEAGYTDGRHPSVVKFSCAEEDASRRDFTINGMFYDPLKEKVIDYVDGRTDLKKGLIRTIGITCECYGQCVFPLSSVLRLSRLHGRQFAATQKI